MSQYKHALNIIAKRSGLEGLVLRPLSAKLLPETIPEKEGWVNREKLLSFNGRSRKPQMALAASMGFKEYSQPGGGCLLTEPQFAKRLKELMSHNELTIGNAALLKIGRHFRIAPEVKLIVGRDEKENNILTELAKGEDYLFMPQDIAGPTASAKGILNEALVQLSASIVCHYCDLAGSLNADIVYGRVSDKEKRLIKISPLTDLQLEALRI